MTDALARGASQPVASPASTLPTQPDSVALEEDDADLTAVPPRRRVPALTKLLFVAIIGALAFGGGVLVQKQHDATLTSASRVPDFASLFGGGGLPAGAGPGAGAAASSAPAAGGSGAGGTGGGSTGDVPVLIGTVESVSGSNLTVKDLGGTSHVVHATAATTLSVVSADWSGSLKVGATVSVQGTKAADGSVTATAVTQH
jgi:Domain of unknown function (DUF5666)